MTKKRVQQLERQIRHLIVEQLREDPGHLVVLDRVTAMVPHSIQLITVLGDDNLISGVRYGGEGFGGQ